MFPWTLTEYEKLKFQMFMYITLCYASDETVWKKNLWKALEYNI